MVQPRTGRRGWMCAVMALAWMTALGLGAESAHASGSSHASYLDGVSGPARARTVDLAGTWGFQTVQTTTCSPAQAPTGPVSCVSSPASQRSTIQVPGGGWVKQGFTDVSEAVYSREIDVPDIRSPQATKLVFGAINHRATLTIQALSGGPVRTVGTT